MRWTKSFAILDKALVFTDTLSMSYDVRFSDGKEIP